MFTVDKTQHTQKTNTLQRDVFRRGSPSEVLEHIGSLSETERAALRAWCHVWLQRHHLTETDALRGSGEAYTRLRFEGIDKQNAVFLAVILQARLERSFLSIGDSLQGGERL